MLSAENWMNGDDDEEDRKLSWEEDERLWQEKYQIWLKDGTLNDRRFETPQSLMAMIDMKVLASKCIQIAD